MKKFDIALSVGKTVPEALQNLGQTIVERFGKEKGATLGNVTVTPAMVPTQLGPPTVTYNAIAVINYETEFEVQIIKPLAKA